MERHFSVKNFPRGFTFILVNKYESPLYKNEPNQCGLCSAENSLLSSKILESKYLKFVIKGKKKIYHEAYDRLKKKKDVG